MQMHIDIWRALLLVFVVLFFCLFSLLGLWRHWGYLTSINDLGAFDQVVWMASKGHSLVNTSIFGTPMHWLGFHFQPILFAFVLLYKITPTVNWFVFAQGAALALSAWPIFLLAERVTASGQAAFMWSLAYLCNPFLLNAAAWDFHPISLAVPFLALGLLAIERKQTVLLLFASIMLLACKEHMGLAVAGLGLLYSMRNRAWTMGLSFFLAGIAAFVLIIAVIIPSYSLSGQHPMFGANVSEPGLGRYSWLGGSLAEVIEHITMKPVTVLQKILIDMGGFSYLILLFLTFLYLPVIAFPWILPGIGDLLINLLSSIQLPRDVYSYHSVTLIPVLLAAAIQGGKILTHNMHLFSPIKIAKFALVINLFFGYVHAPLPLPGSRNIWGAINTVSSCAPANTLVLDVIGKSSATVQANIGAHFSQRKLIYRYPRKVGEAEYVVLRLESPSKWGFVLKHQLVMDPALYLDSVREILKEDRYGVVVWKDPWLILRRGQDDNENTMGIFTKIEQLREQWESILYE